MDGGNTENSKLPFAAEDHRYICTETTSPSPSSMNLFDQNPHAHFSNLYPVFSTMDKFNNEIPTETTRKAYSSFMPYEEDEAFSGDYYSNCDTAAGESCCAKSDTDSCSQVGDQDDGDDGEEEEEEEVSLDELLQNDAKAKMKIEVLAAMVGVDSTEPVIVLTEVVRVLKHLRRMN